jgi:hypothetical protein
LCGPNSGLHAADTEPDVVELLREFEAVQQLYDEAVVAMTEPGENPDPVQNSAQITLAFQAAGAITFDFKRER